MDIEFVLQNEKVLEVSCAHCEYTPYLWTVHLKIYDGKFYVMGFFKRNFKEERRGKQCPKQIENKNQKAEQKIQSTHSSILVASNKRYQNDTFVSSLVPVNCISFNHPNRGMCQ